MPSGQTMTRPANVLHLLSTSQRFTPQQPKIECTTECSIPVLFVFPKVSLSRQSTAFGHPYAAHVGIVTFQANSMRLQMLKDELDLYAGGNVYLCF